MTTRLRTPEAIEHMAREVARHLRTLARPMGPAAVMREIETTVALRRQVREEVRDRVARRALAMVKADPDGKEDQVATKAERMERWLFQRFAEGDQDPRQLHAELPEGLDGMTLGSFRATYFYPVLKDWRARYGEADQQETTEETEDGGGEVRETPPSAPQPRSESFFRTFEEAEVGTRVSLRGTGGSFSAELVDRTDEKWRVHLELDSADADIVDRLLGEVYSRLTGLGGR